MEKKITSLFKQLEMLNSFYGATGNSHFRYYDLRMAEGITKSGQLSIRWIEMKLNKLMNKIMKTKDKDYVVLVDTDSVVLTLEHLVETHCPNKTTQEKIQFMDEFDKTILHPYIEKRYQELADYVNAYSQSMHMKRENLVDCMISVRKKMYCMSVHNSEGVQYKEPKLKIMGLQMVKSSTPGIIRDKLKAALPLILHENEEDIQRYVQECKNDFFKLSLEEIAFPRGVSNLDKFQCNTHIYSKEVSTPIHARGSLLYNHYLKQANLDKIYESIRSGDKIKFVYLKKPNPIHENVIAFPSVLPLELNLHNYIDYDTMFIKTFQDVIQNVISSLGWSPTKISTLEDLFC